MYRADLTDKFEEEEEGYKAMKLNHVFWRKEMMRGPKHASYKRGNHYKVCIASPLRQVFATPLTQFQILILETIIIESNRIEKFCSSDRGKV